MNKKSIFLILALTLSAPCFAQSPFVPRIWGDWQQWGKQADNHYLNPVLPADFSDIDCIEHEGTYYAISSTFQYSPGMVILKSHDMVQWEICGHAVPDISQISEAMTYRVMDRYARGIWAGAIRRHEGKFYVYFGCPDEGLFMTTAPSVEGPWAPLHKMSIGGGWDDPCPLFDDDGNAYLVATHYADNYKSYIFKMTPDGRDVILSTATLVNEGAGREANKLYRFGQNYYHLYSEVDHTGRYLMMQRAASPMGPYTEKRRLAHTQRQWNEPNQGGLLQDKAGNWFFLTHHGTGDWGGRQVSLLPVTWQDGWPVIGQPDKEGLGTMVLRHPMPQTEAAASPRREHRSTSFYDLAWEWNYHPRTEYYSLNKKSLTLRAFRPLEQDNLLKAGNTLTQRSWQTATNEVSVRLDIRQMADGQRSGLCHYSRNWSEFGVQMTDGRRTLYYRTNDSEQLAIATHLSDYIYLRSTWSLDGLCRYAYSTDGKTYHDIGVCYPLEWGHYRGDRWGLFTYNNLRDAGSATFDRYSYVASSQSPEPENVFGHALVPDMIADASITQFGDTFYCYATTDGYGRGLETSGPPVVWKSTDFVHWSFQGTYFPQAYTEKYWAPSKAVFHRGKYYIYPTVNGYMYPAVADSPDGPFRLIKGDSFSVEARLWPKDKVHAIDTELFIDDDGRAYAFWGSRNVATLRPDMATIDSMYTIPTRRTEYSEGPIVFKRKGIYYYLYTIGGNENYEYYYQLSRHSPLGPWETPANDLVCTTDLRTGVFGPGHGCVFNPNGTDDYYLAFLEFGRNSTNRQTYVNRLLFNADGTIRPVEVTLDGVGALRPVTKSNRIQPSRVEASSVATAHLIRHFSDHRCRRTEHFLPRFAADAANGSRWMAADGDSLPWMQLDFGTATPMTRSELHFVRPTAGHAYRLEGSLDGRQWHEISCHQLEKCSPHTDSIPQSYRYLRVTILAGEKGIWEWAVY